jgi:hypothetical protein
MKQTKWKFKCLKDSRKERKRASFNNADQDHNKVCWTYNLVRLWKKDRNNKKKTYW